MRLYLRLMKYKNQKSNNNKKPYKIIKENTNQERKSNKSFFDYLNYYLCCYYISNEDININDNNSIKSKSNSSVDIINMQNSNIHDNDLIHNIILDYDNLHNFNDFEEEMKQELDEEIHFKKHKMIDKKDSSECSFEELVL